MDVTPETVSHLKPRNGNRWARTRQDFVVDDETHLSKKLEGCRQMRETILLGGPQNEDVVQIEDQPNSPRVEEGLQRLCHQREDKWSEAEAEREDQVLVEKTSPTKA